MKTSLPRRDEYLVTLYDGHSVLVRAHNLGKIEKKEDAMRQARGVLCDYLEQGQHQAGMVDLMGKGFMLTICKNPGDIDLAEVDRYQSDIIY